MKGTEKKDLRAGEGGLLIAVLPFENLSGNPAPIKDIRRSVMADLKKSGAPLLDDEELQKFIMRHRVRYVGGMDMETSRAFQEEEGVGAVLITSLGLYSTVNPPKISINSRLVATGNDPVILWMDNASLSGDDSPGILGLGLIEDPLVLAEKATELLTGSLRGYLEGKKDRMDGNARGKFGPKISYLSPVAGRDVKENKVEFTLRNSSGDERVSPARIEVTLSSASDYVVTVEYAATGGTAVQEKDYILKDGVLTFPPGEMVRTIEIGIRDNGVNEDDRTVRVGLKNPAHAVLGDITEHTYTIRDSDPEPSVAFSTPGERVREGAGSATILVELSAVSGKDVTVPFTASGTADNPGNYTITAGPVVIKAGARSAPIVITPRDNGINEDDKTVVVTMGIPKNAAQGQTTVSTVTIVDNDPLPVAAFRQKSSSGAEGVSPARLEVALSAASGRTVTVEYAVTGGTAVKGKDYAVMGSALTFAPGETKKAVEVDVKNNAMYNDDKTIEVGLRNPKNAVLGEAAVHAYTIVNTTPEPAVAFDHPGSSGDEKTGLARLEVSLSAVSGKTATVAYAVTGGTAVRGVNYTLKDGTLTFAPGETKKAIEVGIKDDGLNADNRTIEVGLKDPKDAVIGPTAVHTYTIRDSDPEPVVTFTSASQKVKENAGHATIVVELSAVSGKDVVVPFEVSGTAQSPSNYTVAASPVVIRAGARSAPIVITPRDNGLNEDDKTVVVTMGIPKNAGQGQTTVSTVTIVDNDPLPVAAFRQKSSSGAEGVSPARLEVALSAASGRTVTVEYAVTGGTARGRGADYALKDGALIFLPGETVKTVDMEIKNNGVNNDDKTVEVGLRNPKNAVLGEAAVHTYTIVNTTPEPAVAFTARGQIARKSGSIVIPLELSAVSGRDVIVPFTSGGGDPADYSVVTKSPVVIKAGTRDAAIIINVAETAMDKAKEIIEVALLNPTHASIGGYRTHRLTIHGSNVRPTVAVLPFFNESGRKNAGQFMILRFINELSKFDTFRVIEPGVVRQQLLGFRIIMDQGVSFADLDAVTDILNADLVLSGKVVCYEDYQGAFGRPRVEFTTMLMERKSRNILWTSTSYNEGDDGVFFFDAGRVNTAHAMAAEMARAVLEHMTRR